MKTKADDLAYPIHDHHGGVHSGLTKREHFAGLAMQGMLGNTEVTRPNEIVIAEVACLIADELIEQINGDSDE